MTNITDVTAFPVSFAIPKAFQVSLGIGQAVKRDAVLVRVTCADGMVGWGEAHAARAPTAIAALINSTLRQLVVGIDSEAIDAVWDKVYRMQLASHGMGAAAAIGLSGIDIALWDARGKRLGKPLFELLGGTLQRIPAYAGGIALGYQPIANLIREIDDILVAGYGALKLRLGDSPDRDNARVVATRRHVGSDVTVLTDVNTVYNIDQVQQIMPVLDECAVGWLEEPFPAHAYRAYIAAAKLGKTPLAAGENHYTRFDFERVVDDGAITIWQPDLSKTGGISEGLRIATLAATCGYEIHPHTSVTSINMAASVHFLCAIKNAGYFEADLSSFNPFRSELCSSGFKPRSDGTVEPLDAPGLGVNVNESLIPNYAAIPGAGYV